jgi:hypothetical protein
VREYFLFVIIIITRIVTVEPYTLGFTVAADGIRKHIYIYLTSKSHH